MESTWETRDIPVIDAAARYIEEHFLESFPNGGILAEMTGLSITEVGLALNEVNGHYLKVAITLDGPEYWDVTEIHPDGRRAIGQWPTPESLADRLVEALAAAAEREPDAERRGWLRKTAAYLAGAGRDLAVEVAAAVVTRSTGLG